VSGLTDGVLPGGGPGDPALAQAPQAEPQLAPPGPATVTVFLTNAVRTSTGPGPGPKQLPPAEANALIRAKMAVYGDRPPKNFLYGGQSAPASGTLEFR
jgi:hypothetical protein